MPQICRQCSRANPMEALYCHFDGVLLHQSADAPTDGASINFGARAFTNPLVFAPNRVCRNFDELARACHDDPKAALELLHQGYLENYFSSQGRIDLARAAREAGRSPDRQRGLDEFLGKLPTAVLRASRLRVEPATLDLGTLRVGEDRRIELTVFNDGMRLLHGAVTSECSWLRFGDATALRQKLLEVHRRLLLPVQVRGLALRAYPQPQTGEIVFDTNGGKVVVRVVMRVPVTPFPDGVLAGASTPRDLAAKAKAAPKEAAVLIESGAVSRWYRINGWAYPVQGPTASGIGAVQQFFEALGLVRPPQVQTNTREVYLQGKPGEELKHSIDVFTLENRAVNAHAVCDQPWLQVRRTIPNGRVARVQLAVPVVPYEPGETLRCQVTITANGNQRFVVPVTLAISSSESEFPLYVEEVAEVYRPAEPEPPPVEPEKPPAPRPVEPPTTTWPKATETVRLPRPLVRAWQDEAPAAPSQVRLEGPAVEPAAPLPVPVYARRRGGWRHLAPLLLLALGLLLTTVRDQFFNEDVSGPLVLQLSGPLTPGSELTVTAGIRHSNGSEAIRLELGDGLTCKADPMTQPVQVASAGADGKVTWHVQIGPETHWCRLKVWTSTGLKRARVVALRGP